MLILMGRQQRRRFSNTVPASTKTALTSAPVIYEPQALHRFELLLRHQLCSQQNSASLASQVDMKRGATFQLTQDNPEEVEDGGPNESAAGLEGGSGGGGGRV